MAFQRCRKQSMVCLTFKVSSSPLWNIVVLYCQPIRYQNKRENSLIWKLFVLWPKQIRKKDHSKQMDKINCQQITMIWKVWRKDIFFFPVWFSIAYSLINDLRLCTIIVRMSQKSRHLLLHPSIAHFFIPLLSLLCHAPYTVPREQHVKKQNARKQESQHISYRGII